MRAEALDRVKLVFTLLDADGSGVLEAEDFRLMARNVIAAAPQAGERAKADLALAFEQYWQTLAAELDADRDGRVSFEEYVDCVLSPERFDTTVDTFARALAALGDPDGDGRVEHPLFAAIMSAIGFERPNIDRLFEAFGPVDGRIAVATWVEGIKDYYGPEKAGVAGDHLVPSGAV